MVSPLFLVGDVARLPAGSARPRLRADRPLLLGREGPGPPANKPVSADLRGRPAEFSGGVYFSTWGAEGSRDRRGAHTVAPGGTTVGAVVPVRPAQQCAHPDSGTETALPAEHEGPSARAAQRRPRCNAP